MWRRYRKALDLPLDLVDRFSLGFFLLFSFTYTIFLCVSGACPAVPESTRELIAWNFQILQG